MAESVDPVTFIAARRGPGTTCAIEKRSRPKPADELDSFVAALGFSGLGKDWAEISSEQGRVVVQRILNRDLA